MTALWSYLLAAVGIFGLYVAGKGKRLGWAVGVGAQLLWVAYATVTHQFGFYISAAAYAWVYALNWWRWRRGVDTKAKEGMLAPIDNALTNGSNMIQANIAMDDLCDQLGIDRETLNPEETS